MVQTTGLSHTDGSAVPVGAAASDRQPSFDHAEGSRRCGESGLVQVSRGLGDLGLAVHLGQSSPSCA